jgi:toxin-antitoxin system PIN domain toxin
VIALDTNILVYARREETERHLEARAIVRQLAEGQEPWAIPWPCIYEFLRVVTHPRIFNPPTALAAAIDDLESLFDSPSLVLLGESAGHRTHFRRMVLEGKTSGNLAHDAHVAALGVEHGVRELWTTDRDFSRFAGLRVRDPFADRVRETRVTYRARDRRPRLGRTRTS